MLETTLEAEAPECYFLPPAGPILFTLDFFPDGTVKAVRPEHIYRADSYLSFVLGDAGELVEAGTLPRGDEPSTDVGPAVDCIAAHLRTFRIAPGSATTVEHLAPPHAAELPTHEMVPFDRSALLAALARIDLSSCAGLDGPGRGQALMITSPDGGLSAVRVTGPNRHTPIAGCVNRLFKRVRTASYNGMPNWMLAPYVVPEAPARH